MAIIVNGFEPSKAIIFLIFLLAVSLPKSFEHEHNQRQNIITRKIRATRLAQNSAIHFDISSGKNELFDKRTHNCRESAHAFYESCFQMSSELHVTAANDEFLRSFWEACSKLTISNFRLCLLSEN